jgi:hypothetical protein
MTSHKKITFKEALADKLIFARQREQVILPQFNDSSS